MEKGQYKLLLEVLDRLNRHKILKDLVLVGGWCVYFYREYYFKGSYISPFRTPDLDFLVPAPGNIISEGDLPEILDDLGFIEDFRGSQGYVQLSHPDLKIEFLVHGKGRGTDRPVLLKKWNMNAQPLRFMDILLIKTLDLNIKGIKLRVPHPACFSFQKLIISSRRTGRTAHKADRDRQTAIEVIDELMADADEQWLLKDIFTKIEVKQQKQIIKILSGDRNDIIRFLK
ncbi:MAG: GSU2403 family nucleotidyltransferase fold protein [Candidatus Omnitrophota bacterium]